MILFSISGFFPEILSHIFIYYILDVQLSFSVFVINLILQFEQNLKMPMLILSAT